MSSLLESHTGIWLNTQVRFFDIQSQSALRIAQNDSDWRLFGSDFSLGSELAALVEPHLFQNPCRTLYTHEKFKLVTEIVSNYDFQRHNVEPAFKLTTLDIGCSVQMLRRHLDKSIRDLRYIGVDSLPMICPDILCDVTSSGVNPAFKALRPDVVLALDLLPILHDTKVQLVASLSRWLSALDKTPELWVFTIPECYESDDHLLTLKSEQWLELLNELFIVEDIQAVGFLSALPYWIGNKLPMRLAARLRRSLNEFRGPLSDSYVLKTVESMLTLAFKRTKILRRFSHSLLVTVRPRIIP